MYSFSWEQESMLPIQSVKKETYTVSLTYCAAKKVKVQAAIQERLF